LSAPDLPTGDLPAEWLQNLHVSTSLLQTQFLWTVAVRRRLCSQVCGSGSGSDLCGSGSDVRCSGSGSDVCGTCPHVRRSGSHVRRSGSDLCGSGPHMCRSRSGEVLCASCSRSCSGQVLRRSRPGEVLRYGLVLQHRLQQRLPEDLLR
jgi:hypothetical protein